MSWTLYGSKYSLEEFKAHHPGGTLALTLCQGSDITQLFEQYHLRPEAALTTFSDFSGKAVLVQRPSPSFDAFHRDILSELKVLPSIKASAWTFFFSILGTLCVLFLYVQWARGSLAALLVLPFAHWLLAVNVSHDANHFALSRYPQINELFGMTGAPLFFNSGQWLHQHTIYHHVHTNVVGLDHDLHHFGHRARLHPAIPWMPPHAMQVIFTALAFPLATAAQTLLFPVRLLLSLGFFNQPHESPLPPLNLLPVRIRFATVLQVAAALSFVAYPLYTWGISWGACVWIVYPYAIAGVIFMAVTQVSHVQSCTQQPIRQSQEQQHWAVGQVASALDYAQGCAWTSFLTGALNMQALHHIVPGCHSSRLLALYPRFRAVCQRHGVHINEVASFAQAFSGFVQHLRALSVDQREPCKKIL